MFECPSYCDRECTLKMYKSGVAFSAFAVSIAFLISSFIIIKHLRNYNKPYIQSKIIVILMMAPFYGIISILSLEFPNIAGYLELIRDIYLALLLFTFFYLMFAYIAYDAESDTASDERVYEIMIQHEKSIHYFFPLGCCLDDYLLTDKAKAKYFTYRCKKFVLQYFVLKPVLIVILLITHPFVPGHHSIKAMSGVMKVIICISEGLSLYFLILFYKALSLPLAPHKPLLKFLIIKITLFFTFWQGLTLDIFRERIAECFEYDEQKYSPENITSSIENTLVCIEMFIMTLASMFAFGYGSFEQEQNNRQGNLYEVFAHIWASFKYDLRLIKPKDFNFKPEVESIEMNLIKRQDSENVDIKIYDKSRLSKAMNISYM